MLFLLFVRSLWCLPSFVLVVFLLSWTDRLSFSWSRTLCWPTIQVSDASWQVIFSLWPWFLPYFIFVSMAIFIILLIFSTVSTFVFKSNRNILDNTLRNRFLSLSLLINLSNYFCTKSGSVVKKSGTPSVASLLLFSQAKNVSSSLLISSKSWVSFASSVEVSSNENTVLVDPYELPTDIFDTFFSTIFVVNFVKKIGFLAVFYPKRPSLCWFRFVLTLFFVFYW